MLDDVVGLVMVQIISNLGTSGSGFNSITVVRPVFVSLGLAVLCPLACWILVAPFTLFLNKYREKNPKSRVQRLIIRQHSAFILHTLILIAMVTGSSYAGTSNLFAAYLSGAMVSWWDSEVPHPPTQQEQVKRDYSINPADKGDDNSLPQSSDSKLNNDMNSVVKIASQANGAAIFRAYYTQPTEKILKPFFFVCFTTTTPCSCQSLIVCTGVYWFLYPHFEDVHRICCLARHHLYTADDNW